MVMPTSAKPHEGARVNWIHWIERIGLFGLLSAISIGLGLDSASAISPAFVEGVPKIFRSQSSVVASNVELASEDFATAYESASGAVLKQPLDPEALFVTGVAANELGKRELASSAVGAAAGLGWRNIAAQVAVLQGAVNQRHWQAAAPRIAAIVRLDRLDPLPPEAVRHIIDDPVGKNVLAKEYVRQPRGWSALSSWLFHQVGTQEMVSFLSTLSDATKATDCASLANQARSLLGSSGYGYVDAAWSGRCTKGHSTARVVEFPNSAADGVVGPFDWMFPSQGAISWSVQASEIGPVISAMNSDPINRVLAQRVAMLKPGLYHVSIGLLTEGRIDYDNPLASRRINIVAACTGASHVNDSKFPRNHGESRDLVIEVPRGCPVQIVSVYIPPGEFPPFKLSMVARK